jgi:hypothetical protein
VEFKHIVLWLMKTVLLPVDAKNLWPKMDGKGVWLSSLNRESCVRVLHLLLYNKELLILLRRSCRNGVSPKQYILRGAGTGPGLNQQTASHAPRLCPLGFVRSYLRAARRLHAFTSSKAGDCGRRSDMGQRLASGLAAVPTVVATAESKSKLASARGR